MVSLGVACVPPAQVPEHVVPGGKRTSAVGGPQINGGAPALPHGSVGPYLRRGAASSLLVWAEPEAEDARSWVSVRLDAKGQVQGEARRLGAANPDLRSLRLIASGTKTWVLGLSEPVSGAQVTLLGLDESGAVETPELEVVSGTSAVLWANAIPFSDSGLLVVWAERVGNHAVIKGRHVSDVGELGKDTNVFHETARAWQLTRVEKGALLAVLDRSGVIDLVPVGSGGSHSVANRLSGVEHAEGELDLLPLGAGRVLLAFSQNRLEPHIYSVLLDDAGVALEKPKLAVPAKGPQLLQQLIGDSKSQYIAWRNLREAPEQVLVSQLTKSGHAEGTVLTFPAAAGAEDGPASGIEFSANAEAFAALLSPSAGSGASRSLGPTVLQFDSALTRGTSRRVQVGAKVADVAWDLQCAGTSCWSLAANLSEPAEVRVSSGQGETPQTLAGREDLERADRVAVVSVTPQLASLAASENDVGSTLAWLSYYDPSLPYLRPKTLAPDGRLAPVQAELRTQFLPPSAPADTARPELPPSESISVRARSVANISLASKADRQLLVWAAIDNGVPQLFTTALDARGRRLRQGMLTRQKGEILATAATATNNGWAVAWIDDRRGQRDVYLALVGASLERLSPDTRLELGDYEALNLDLGFHAGELWLSVVAGASSASKSEPTRAPDAEWTPGSRRVVLGERVVVQRYDARNLALLAALRLDAKAATAVRSGFSEKGTLIAWLTRGAESGALHHALVPLNAERANAAQRIPLESGASSFALTCGEQCRVLVNQERADGPAVCAINLEGTTGAVPIARISDPRVVELGPVQTPSRVAYYFDVDREGVPALHQVVPASTKSGTK